MNDFVFGAEVGLDSNARKNRGGSKLNETARSYQEIALKFKAFQQYEFIWITDGQGWLSAKTKLQEAYKNVKIYNLYNLKDFIAGIYNDNKA